MKLHLLENIIHKFLESQLRSKETAWYFPHSLVGHFNESWNENKELPLREKYDWALRNEISQSWWKKENYRPREIMLRLIDTDPELASIAFKDLANESASLDGRLSRFNYYAEELLQMHRKTHLRETETHHHQDAEMMSLYLAGMFPEKYSLYPGLDVFQSFCKAVGSPEIPVVDDLVRYAKVTSIVFRFLQQNVLYDKLADSRINGFHKVKFIPYQATYEVVSFAGNSFNSSSG